MKLRPYQKEAKKAVLSEWNKGVKSTLMVLPTGTGKTIVFASIIKNIVEKGGRCLILAHRGELLDQAADKLSQATGLGCALEKAESTAIDSWFQVVVGSVQTMMRKNRREGHYYSHIIIDEAHHAVSKSYTEILNDFPDAKILGVTATADRGDKRSLAEVFDTLAYEYSLPDAIRSGFLVPIKALTLPLNIDLNNIKMSVGDFNVSEVGTTLDPYLDEIADKIIEEASDRKTVCFLPLIATSQKFLQKLLNRGVNAREVNGESFDRAETLEWFDKAGPGAVLLNAMLLTEGWDCPSADCICVLRPTKIRSLYTQMVGRGTRLFPGKKDLLLLDFLWHSERHELCRPLHLICDNPELTKEIGKILEEQSLNNAVDLLEAEEAAESAATEAREEALKKALKAQRSKRRALVDPLQYETSIKGKIESYSPDLYNLKGLAPPTIKQLKFLENAGINPDEVSTIEHASQLIELVNKRRALKLSTPKQIRFLENRGFENVGMWSFDAANKMITRTAANSWRTPVSNPGSYVPSDMNYYNG